jgi:hypothetical protein
MCSVPELDLTVYDRVACNITCTLQNKSNWINDIAPSHNIAHPHFGINSTLMPTLLSVLPIPLFSTITILSFLITCAPSLTHPWGSHVQLTHIFFDNPIENVLECQKCDSVEHASPTLEAKSFVPGHSVVLQRSNIVELPHHHPPRKIEC